MDRLGMPEGKRWMLLASVLGALFLGVICLSEEEPASMAAGGVLKELPETEEKEPEREGVWKILGTGMASEGKALKNPFTLRHEERGAAGDAGQPEKAPQVSPPAASALPERRESPTEGGEAPAEWVLKGILSGGKGNIAIVSNGKETRDVAVGERFGSRIVVAIEENSLSFSDDGGEGRMYLPGF